MVDERNLLFGTLALQMGLIDEAQFATSCKTWLAGRAESIESILTRTGAINGVDAASVARMVESRLGRTPVQNTRQADRDYLRALAALEASGLGIEDDEPEEGEPQDEGAGVVRVSQDRYTLERLHAQGGLGRVWLARDEALGREVALKELRPERSGSAAIGARFLEEARITGQLEHPNIVPVYELARGGTADGEPPFYTMRFVRGRTLAEAIRSYHRDRLAGNSDPLAFRALLNALVAVANAVAFAHDRGVIHRDLKPQNVVLGNYGEVIVLDWGLAKLVGDEGGSVDRSEDAPPAVVPFVSREADPSRASTMEGQAVGTPAYMPPEQAAGDSPRVGRRSDVYGLGAILYEVLTGRPPYSEPDSVTLLRRVLEEPPARPRALCSGVDPALEAVCLKALSRDPASRYDGAAEVASEIQRWLAGEPVQAFDEPWTWKARRWVSRHRTTVSAGIAAAWVALIALVIATALLAYSRDRERQARKLADERKRFAEVQQEKAIENFGMARRAVDRYFTIVSESELLRQPGLQKLREPLLREALKYYERFAADHAEDPTLQADLAAAYFRMGLITEDIGSKSEAIGHYQSARVVLESLWRDRPDDPERTAALADGLNRLGGALLAMGRQNEALTVLREARSLAVGLTALFPEDPAHRGRLAGVDNNLGNAERAGGLVRDALASYQRARREFALLAVNAPEGDEARRAEYRVGIAGTDQNIGVMLRENGRLDGALAALEAACSLRRDLVADRPSDHRLRRELARGLNDLGLVQSELGQHEEALASHTEAMTIQQELADASPAMTDYQRDLALSLAHLGQLSNAAARLDQALQFHRRSRAVFQKLADANPGVDLHRDNLAAADHNLGVVLQESGRLDEAREAFRRALEVREELESEHPRDPLALANLATVWNSLGGLERSAGRPTEALAWHRKARDVFEALASERPRSDARGADLAQTYNHLGLALQALDRNADALRVHERARNLLQSLADSSPGSTPLRRELAVTLLNIAVLHRRAARLGPALDTAREASRHFEEIHQDSPDAIQARRDLVSCLDNLGELAREIGRTDEAVEQLEKARDLQAQVIDQPSGGPQAGPEDLSLMGAVLAHLGRAREQTGDLEGAIEATLQATTRQSAALSAVPGFAAYRRFLSAHLGQLARLQLRLGRRDESVATSLRRRDLAATVPPDPEELVQSAIDLARCLPDNPGPADASPGRAAKGTLERLATAAWEALRSAVAAGFPDPASLRNHPGLGRLKALPGVGPWLEEIGRTRTPGASPTPICAA